MAFSKPFFRISASKEPYYETATSRRVKMSKVQEYLVHRVKSFLMFKDTDFESGDSKHRKTTIFQVSRLEMVILVVS